MEADVFRIRLFCAVKGLELYKRTKMLLTRGATPTKLMKIISDFSGNKYKRNGIDMAIKDGRNILNGG